MWGQVEGECPRCRAACHGPSRVDSSQRLGWAESWVDVKELGFNGLWGRVWKHLENKPSPGSMETPEACLVNSAVQG